MRLIAFAPEDRREFDYIYQNLLFPAKKPLPRNEEAMLARLLDGFETVGEPTKQMLGEDTFTVFKLKAAGGSVMVEEADFTLLLELLKASSPNGVGGEAGEAADCRSLALGRWRT
jgi:uncharacterized protein with von Willebrand factor type A (vWA) domain